MLQLHQKRNPMSLAEHISRSTTLDMHAMHMYLTNFVALVEHNISYWNYIGPNKAIKWTCILSKCLSLSINYFTSKGLSAMETGSNANSTQNCLNWFQSSSIQFDRVRTGFSIRTNVNPENEIRAWLCLVHMTLTTLTKKMDPVAIPDRQQRLRLHILAHLCIHVLVPSSHFSQRKFTRAQQHSIPIRFQPTSTSELTRIRFGFLTFAVRMWPMRIDADWMRIQCPMRTGLNLQRCM